MAYGLLHRHEMQASHYTKKVLFALGLELNSRITHSVHNQIYDCGASTHIPLLLEETVGVSEICGLT